MRTGIRYFTALLIGLLLTAAPAHAIYLVSPTGQNVRYWDRLADLSLTPLPEDEIVDLRSGLCPTREEAAGCALIPQQGRATIYLATGRTLFERTRTLYHELGHIEDARAWTNSDRGTFLAIWRRPELPWSEPAPDPTRPTFIGDDQASYGEEWLADALQACARLGGEPWQIRTIPEARDWIGALEIIPASAMRPRDVRARMIKTCLLAQRAHAQN